jgi:hypothetical protein
MLQTMERRANFGFILHVGQSRMVWPPDFLRAKEIPVQEHSPNVFIYQGAEEEG